MSRPSSPLPNQAESQRPAHSHVVLQIGDATTVALASGRVYRIGRGPSNDVRIEHSSVADQHCLLRIGMAAAGGAPVAGPSGAATPSVAAAPSVEVEDLQSEVGTRVDGVRVYKSPVQPGQTMLVGDIALRWQPAPPAVPHRGPDAPLRHRQAQSLADVLAEELRRAPSFTLSLAIHAILLLLLLYFADRPPREATTTASVTLKQQDEPADLLDLELPPLEKPTIEEEISEVLLDDRPLLDEREPLAEIEAAPLEEAAEIPAQAGQPSGTGWLTSVTGGGRSILSEGRVGRGGFRRAVTAMRHTGLEIVFVFDSTSSMSDILEGTKDRIVQMVEMLHALVPDARVGIVTYRDSDASDGYLTRAIPLSADLYRAINFMQTIEAGGGGDTPEAVCEGLAKAFAQPWQPKSRRVVVLVGDAPPHDYEERKIAQMVRRFTAHEHAQVHAIVTSPYGADRLPEATLAAFRRIAAAGGGECIGFEHEHQVLQQVLSLAFGQQYRRNLDELAAVLAERRSKISTRALDLVQRQDLPKIEAHLLRAPVWDDLIKALRRTKSREVAGLLVRLMCRADVPEPGRQAAAYALQDALGLPAPPTDPERGGPLDAEAGASLLQAVAERLR